MMIPSFSQALPDSVKKDVGTLLRKEGVGLEKLRLWCLQLRTLSLNSGQLK